MITNLSRRRRHDRPRGGIGISRIGNPSSSRRVSARGASLKIGVFPASIGGVVRSCLGRKLGRAAGRGRRTSGSSKDSREGSERDRASGDKKTPAGVIMITAVQRKTEYCGRTRMAAVGSWEIGILERHFRVAGFCCQSAPTTNNAVFRLLVPWPFASPPSPSLSLPLSHPLSLSLHPICALLIPTLLRIRPRPNSHSDPPHIT